MAKDSHKQWRFTREINAKGYAYIYAYQTEWDPVRKQSRRSSKLYVGRLAENGRVLISKNFALKMPEYAEGEYYFGPDKTLVAWDPSQKAQVAAGTTPCAGRAAEESEELQTRSIGASWAIEQLALQTGLIEDLTTVFGPEDALRLIGLAVYKLDGGASLNCLNDWAEENLVFNCDFSELRMKDLFMQADRSHSKRFFMLRHDRILRTELQNAGAGDPAERRCYALDCASVATNSISLESTPFGRTVRNPHLTEVNCTFGCDERAGEILFARASSGSVPDVSALKQILFNMRLGRQNLSEVVLVTDRTYASILSAQKMFDVEMRFVQGVRATEDFILNRLDEIGESLKSLRLYDSALDVYAATIDGPAARGMGNSRLERSVYTHIYRFPGAREAVKAKLSRRADDVLRLKNRRHPVPPELWKTYGRFIREEQTDSKPTRWIRDDAAIDLACRYSGYFALRTNEFSDPLRALQVYMLRNALESDFNRYNNWGESDRLRYSEAAHSGKIFAAALTASLRIMMLKRINRNRTGEQSLLHASLDSLFVKLKKLKADKRPKAQGWVVRKVAQEQQDLFELLGVDAPPKVLRP